MLYDIQKCRQIFFKNQGCMECVEKEFKMHELMLISISPMVWQEESSS